MRTLLGRIRVPPPSIVGTTSRSYSSTSPVRIALAARVGPATDGAHEIGDERDGTLVGAGQIQKRQSGPLHQQRAELIQTTAAAGLQRLTLDFASAGGHGGTG